MWCSFSYVHCIRALAFLITGFDKQLGSGCGRLEHLFPLFSWGVIIVGHEIYEWGPTLRMFGGVDAVQFELPQRTASKPTAGMSRLCGAFWKNIRPQVREEKMNLS